MKLLFDTNVILDNLLNRSSFASDSTSAILSALGNEYECMVSASSITDLFYIINKQTGNRSETWEKVAVLSHIFEVIDVTREDIFSALDSRMRDFEDAVVAYTAARHHASYIVTRNVDDFKFSPVPAINPSELCEIFIKEENMMEPL